MLIQIYDLGDVVCGAIELYYFTVYCYVSIILSTSFPSKCNNNGDDTLAKSTRQRESLHYIVTQNAFFCEQII